MITPFSSMTMKLSKESFYYYNSMLFKHIAKESRTWLRGADLKG